MAVEPIYDLVIVGGGITGLSAAMHAQNRGIKNLKIICSQDLSESASYKLRPSYVFPGYFDHFTRMSHVHGVKKAGELWAFSKNACDSVNDFLTAESIPCTSNPHYRLLMTEPETKEAQIVEKQFATLGWKASVCSAESLKIPHRDFKIQDFGESGHYFDALDLLKAVRGKLSSNAFMYSKVQSLARHREGHELSLADGTKVLARLLILANHLDIPRLVPALNEVFVSMAEQSHVYVSEENCDFEGALVANYGHELFVKPTTKQFYASGARFLRKHAGIGPTEINGDEKIKQYLADRIKTVFGLKKAPECKETWFGLDCRPCDELPVIGPMYGESTLLLASGYMNQGFSFGFFAGRILADLVSSGKSPELPQAITPARLRSLKEVD